MSAGDSGANAALRHRAAAGARWTATMAFVRVAIQLLQIAILARLLEVRDFGLYEMILVVIVVGQAFADAGISNAIIHFQNASRRELSSLYWLNVFAGAVIFVLFWLCVPLIAGVYDEPRLAGLLRYASIVFLIAPFGQQFQVLLEKELRFRRLAVYEMTSTTAAAILAIVLALRGAGVVSLLALTLCYYTLRTALLAGFGWREWRPGLHFRWQDCSRFMRFGLFQMGERATNILSQQLDKILIGFLIGMEPLGYYGLAYRLIIRPYRIINPIFTRVAFPVFSRVQSDVSRLRSGFAQIIEVIAGIMLPLYGALCALAPQVVLVQFGPGYEPTIPLLRTLSILGAFYALGNPLGSVLLARGRADVGFYLNVARSVLFVVAISAGARYGVEGIAWGLVVVTGGVMFPVGFWIRRHLIDMRPAEYIAAFAPFAVATLVAGLAARFAVGRLGGIGAGASLVVGLPLMAGLYLGILFFWHRRRLVRMLSLVRS